jgi:hypothetical protein
MTARVHHIPPYESPLLEPYRCPGCGRRYLIWKDKADRPRAELEASALGATLVDVSINPVSYCSCGELMDIMESASERVM